MTIILFKFKHHFIEENYQQFSDSTQHLTKEKIKHFSSRDLLRSLFMTLQRIKRDTLAILELLTEPKNWFSILYLLGGLSPDKEM